MEVTALWSHPYVDKPLVSLAVASLRVPHIESGGSKCELG
jgi:hypothetical protein